MNLSNAQMQIILQQDATKQERNNLLLELFFKLFSC